MADKFTNMFGFGCCYSGGTIARGCCTSYGGDPSVIHLTVGAGSSSGFLGKDADLTYSPAPRSPNGHTLFAGWISPLILYGDGTAFGIFYYMTGCGIQVYTNYSGFFGQDALLCYTVYNFSGATSTNCNPFLFVGGVENMNPTNPGNFPYQFAKFTISG